MRQQHTGPALTLALALSLTGGPGLAAELTLETYTALSIQRLELAEGSWSSAAAPPTAEAMAALFASHGTTEAAFIAYTSAQRRAIDDHLAAHPAQRQRIQELSASVREAIQASSEANGNTGGQP
jgi:hypothetical protein